LNVQPPIVVVGLENVRLVVFDVPKKAVPVGTVAGVQLAAVSKSFVPGVASQVASCARAAPGKSAAAATSAVVASSAAIRPFRCSRVDSPVPGLATAADGK
jgi:hypothetical protein